MPRYLISFDDGSMDHISEEDLPAVGEASRAVVREIKHAGAWIFGGGVMRQQASIVATDGSLAWAAKIAESCRCAQEVREIMYDPES